MSKISDLPTEDRLFFLKKFKLTYFQENFDDINHDLEKECVSRGYVDNKIKFITNKKYVSAYVVVKMTL